jgi:hypothetical protein
MSGGKPIPIYNLHLESHSHNLDKTQIKDLLSTNGLLYKEIYISPERDRGVIYFHDSHEMNLAFHAFQSNGGYDAREISLQTTPSTKWMDGSE